MRRAHIVALICLLISFALASFFATTYREGSLATGTTVATESPLIQKTQLSPEAIETTNLIGMGVIVGAVAIVSVLVYFRKPAPSDDAV